MCVLSNTIDLYNACHKHHALLPPSYTPGYYRHFTTTALCSSELGGEANFGSLWRKVWIAPPNKDEIVAICSQAAGPRVQRRAIRALLETCR